jgi:hypothetical protein
MKLLRKKLKKKQSITQNDLKIKKQIKRTRVKIEIRNKLEGNHKFSIRWLNFKEK